MIEPDFANMVWHSSFDPPFRVLGFAWPEEMHSFRRLPKRSEFPLPPAPDKLAENPSGGQVHFRTNSHRCAVQVRLKDSSDRHGWADTGQCGIDCYLGEAGKQAHRWTSPFAFGVTEYESLLYDIRDTAMRTVTLNLPLGQDMTHLRIGLDKNSSMEESDTCKTGDPIVFYGTSITMGCSVSRPGVAYTNILSRKLDREIINLGFAGAGRGEPEMARAIATIPQVSLFVLDYNANCRGVDNLKATFPEFVRILRKKHPTVPILVPSAIPCCWETVEASAERKADSDYLEEAVKELQQGGDVNIQFLDGLEMMGEGYNEFFVDGAHPSDAGNVRIAERLEPVLKGILN